MKSLKVLLSLVITMPVIFATAQTPTLQSFSPELGSVGDIVTLTGENFSVAAEENIVSFGSVRAGVISSSPTELSVVVPYGATYKPITINVNGLIAESSKPFRVTFSDATTSYGNQQYLYGGGQVKWSTVSDIDNDGKPDLLAVDEAGSQLNVWRNTSTTGVISWDSFWDMRSFVTDVNPYAIEAEDLNGDGWKDVVVTSSVGFVLVYQNNSSPGNISFLPGIPIETAPSPFFIAIRDLNKDGKPDVAVACAKDFGVGAVSILQNTSVGGAISFAPQVELSAGEGGVWCVRLQDIDNDTRTDILVTSGGSGFMSVFQNLSDPGGAIGPFAPRVDFPAGGYPAIMAVSDFDNDGKPDVAVGNAADFMTLFRNTSTPGTIDGSSFISETIFTPAPWNATAGDVDGDGKVDLLVRNTNSEVLIFRNNSVPGAFSFSPSPLWVGGGPLAIDVVDLDGDERSDLVISNEVYNYVQVLQHISLNPPVALPPSFVSNTGFEATWLGVEGSGEYRVDVSPAEDFSIPVEGYVDRLVWGSPLQTIRQTVGGLNANTVYYYRVRSVVNGMASQSSETITVQTQPHPGVASPNVWAVGFDGSGEDEVQSMAVDDDGNIYIAGHFTGSLSLGSFHLSGQGEFDIFIAKLDAKRKVLWAGALGGPSNDNEVSIVVDKKSLYVMAQSSGGIDVDPGPGVKIFDNVGSPWTNDGFFAKYDAKNGKLQWAHQLQDASGWSSSSIAVDKSAVYITGYFSGAVDFNPGAGEYILNSFGGSDIFVGKYSLQGNFIWAQQIGGYGEDMAWGILINDDQMYIHGSFEGYVDFDPKKGEHFLYDNYGGAGFFGRYDAESGKFRYAHAIGNGTILALSKFQNNIYIAGDFAGPIDADPGSGEYYIGSSDFNNLNGLVGQYDAKDGSFHWANAILCTNFIGPRRVLADATGIYLSGYLSGSADFDGGYGEVNRTSTGIDAFSANYGLAGNLRWAKAMGTPGRAVSIAATLTSSAYYLGGLYASQVNFDPYAGNVFMNSSTGTNDIFVAKYKRSAADHSKLYSKHETESAFINGREASEGLQLFPNPATDLLSIRVEEFANGPVEYSIRDVMGRITLMPWTGSGEQSVQVGHLRSGVYFVTARQGYKMKVQRFVKD